MTLSLAFNLVIFYVSVFWLAMIVLPGWGVTKKVMGSYLPFIPVCLAYIYYLLTATDPASLGGAFNPQLATYAELFGQEGGALVVSIHFLVMDLFVGRWIYWEGQEKKILTTHSLILCLFFGPAGLLAHIITDRFFGDRNNEDTSSQNSKGDFVEDK